ncbi:MAG: carbohydrate ABC transporter permease [Acidimicrobiia bacterium]|nr:carbohydrate ABC transporter permease [Acidimicrobiia bacterium]
MTTTATKTTQGVLTARRPLGKRIYRFLRSIPTWFLWVLVILWTIPTFSLFVNSFRTRDAQRGSGFWNAFSDNANGYDFPTLANYREVLFPDVGAGVGNALLNSASIAIVATIIPIAIAAFAAYAFAWIDFKGREWLFIATVALLAVPSQVALIPLLSAYSNGVAWTIPLLEKTVTLFPDLDLSGEIPSVWLTHTGFAMPFAIFLLHNYIAGLPKDLFESASIDGADHFTVFWRLVLPLSVPVLAAFAIFQFLWTWNDYLIALTMIGGNRANLPGTIVVASLAGEFGAREHLLTAGAFIITLGPLIVFFLLQRFFVRGITAGSVKG